MAVAAFGAPDWLASERTVDEVRRAWRRLRPLNQWVLANVGEP
jgi:hypothetical protein